MVTRSTFYRKRALASGLCGDCYVKPRHFRIRDGKWVVFYRCKKCMLSHAKESAEYKRRKRNDRKNSEMVSSNNIK